MAFWTEQSLNPKRKFRWVVEFQTDKELLKVAAKSVAKPNFEIGNTQHKFINHIFNFPNRVEWKPIEVKLVDHIGKRSASGQESVTKALFNVLKRSGYKFPDSGDKCQLAVTKAQATKNGIKGVIIKQLSGEGPENAAASEILETWTLKNPWVSTLNFGDLSYEDDGLLELSMTITYDWAEFSGK
tara:strand:- start:62 stop:616 length:555 start_codon:yes stop_codon:yes gene_type:complete